jgi:ketosteroid isomerase-like protein
MQPLEQSRMRRRNMSQVMQANEAIIRNFAAAWASRDLETVMQFFAENAVYRGSVGPEPGESWHGKAAIRQGIAKMFAFGAGSTASQGRVVSIGEIVFAEWTYHFAEAGKPPVVGCDLFELYEGLITLKDAYRKLQAPVVPGMD